LSDREEYKKKMRERAREERRKAYQRAKLAREKHEEEMKRLVEQGIIEPEQDVKPKQKIPSRKMNGEQNHKPKPSTPKEELWAQIQKASELEELRKRAEKKQHLRLISSDADKSAT